MSSGFTPGEEFPRYLRTFPARERIVASGGYQAPVLPRKAQLKAANE
jgi:hypothetical protein